MLGVVVPVPISIGVYFMKPSPVVVVAVIVMLLESMVAVDAVAVIPPMLCVWAMMPPVRSIPVASAVAGIFLPSHVFLFMSPPNTGAVEWLSCGGDRDLARGGVVSVRHVSLGAEV